MNGQVALAKAPTTAAASRLPGFLAKLYKIVDDPSTDATVKWNDAGDSFIILRPVDFERNVLPVYYKHNHLSSFVRQLNMYGFHKVTHIEENGDVKPQEQIHEFSNPNFLRGQKDLLNLVMRKKTRDGDDKDGIDYNSIMSEIQAIKRHQLSISQDLRRIQADNQALWQEQIDTRSRHTKHQETIEKILTFLGTVYGNQYNSEDKSLQSKPKRRRLLLEDDTTGAIEDLGLQDERTKERFEDMFRSASVSPVLRPLRQPATETISGRPESSSETRFTLPQYDARRQMTATGNGQQRPQNTTHNNARYGSSLQAAPPSNVQGSNGNQALINSLDNSPQQGLDLTLSPALMNESLNPANMQLTTTTAKRLSDNDARTKELEHEVAMNGRGLADLEEILSWDFTDYENFDQFMNSDPALQQTSQDNEGFDPNSAFSYLNDPNAMQNAQYDMNPPLHVPGNEQNGLHATVNGLKSESTTATPSPAASAPASTTGSVKGEDEEIEEIDMDRARGKKRKSEG